MLLVCGLIITNKEWTYFRECELNNDQEIEIYDEIKSHTLILLSYSPSSFRTYLKQEHNILFDQICSNSSLYLWSREVIVARAPKLEAIVFTSTCLQEDVVVLKKKSDLKIPKHKF